MKLRTLIDEAVMNKDMPKILRHLKAAFSMLETSTEFEEGELNDLLKHLEEVIGSVEFAALPSRPAPLGGGKFNPYPKGSKLGQMLNSGELKNDGPVRFKDSDGKIQTGTLNGGFYSEDIAYVRVNGEIVHVPAADIITKK